MNKQQLIEALLKNIDKDDIDNDFFKKLSKKTNLPKNKIEKVINQIIKYENNVKRSEKLPKIDESDLKTLNKHINNNL